MYEFGRSLERFSMPEQLWRLYADCRKVTKLLCHLGVETKIMLRIPSLKVEDCHLVSLGDLVSESFF